MEENISPTEEQPAATVQDVHRPEDIAATFFKREKGSLRKMLDGMSQKQIRRFVMHVASYPLTEAGDMPQSELEKKAAYLLSEMVMNKMVMQLAVEMDKAQEAEKQLTEENTNV